MKKRNLREPHIEIILALIVLIIICAVIRSCDSKQDQDQEQAQLNEMLDYHSAPGQLIVERNGYINIIKQ